MSQPTILDRIVEQRREDVQAAKAREPLARLRARLDDAPPARDFIERLRTDSPMAVIAEIKRASPSRGDIAPGTEAGPQALAYARAGAAGISVLTEPHWFKGEIDDLCEARAAVEELGEQRPVILRKDFIFDEYQVVEGRAAGADSVLLIVASLDGETLRRLITLSRSLMMEPLVEVNSAAEMGRALDAGATFIGINNRDLRDFSVDLGTTDRLAGMATGASVFLAALSGISSRADVERFQVAGAGAVLVGEALMRAPDPGAMIRELAGRS